MSIGVELEELRTQAEGFPGDAFLVTVSDDGRPHTVAVRPQWDGDALTVPAGRTTSSNVASRPLVALLWPPPAVGEYSLIVDAEARAGDDGEVVLHPTRAVLHRPAPSGRGSDCQTIL
jgi:hypothetical protein